MTPLDALVERTMNAFGYDLALLARAAGRRAHGERAQADAPRGASSSATRAATCAPSSPRRTRAPQRDEREGQAPVQAEDYDGVRIMTVHGAKGLEFPVVAVPDLDRALDAGHRSGDIWIGRLERRRASRRASACGWRSRRRSRSGSGS